MFISHDIAFFTVISTRSQKDALLNAISDYGGRFTKIIYGRGTFKASSITEALGFIPEKEKLIITFFVSKSHSDDILNMLTNDFHFDEQNTGIAFSHIIKSFAI